VLEQFWRALKRREIYADTSTKWCNPQAELLEGDQWEAVRPDDPPSPEQSPEQSYGTP
jgi:hypothetical protein